MLFTNTERFNFAKDPAVVNFKGTYYLYYTIKIREKDDDGIKFTKNPDNPVYKPTDDWCCGKAGEWNSSESGHPYAFRDDDGRAYFFYQGSSDMGKTWYLTKTEIAFDENNIPRLV